LDEATLVVNESAWIVGPGDDASLVPVPEVYAGVTEVMLRPGHYRIELRANGASDAVRLSLRPGGRAIVRLESAADGIDLSIVEESE
ncbi:MAG: hypothetical protein ACOC1U_10000, partial [Spirochaetota bacterium]